MIKKVVTKRSLSKASSTKEDLAFWLKKTPEGIVILFRLSNPTVETVG